MPLNLVSVCENTSSLKVRAPYELSTLLTMMKYPSVRRLPTLHVIMRTAQNLVTKKDEIAHLYVSTDSHHVLGNTIWSAGQQNQTAVDPFHPQIPGIINEHKETAYLYDMEVCLVYHMFP
jgi:hypothetical protein